MYCTNPINAAIFTVFLRTPHSRFSKKSTFQTQPKNHALWALCSNSNPKPTYCAHTHNILNVLRTAVGHFVMKNKYRRGRRGQQLDIVLIRSTYSNNTRPSVTSNNDDKSARGFPHPVPRMDTRKPQPVVTADPEHYCCT